MKVRFVKFSTATVIAKHKPVVVFPEKGNKGEVLVTPWFKLIVEKFLIKWWDNLSDLKSVKDQATIHRM